MKALYWFRQDLRLNDNLALRLACDKADELLAVVLADHQRTQTTPWGFARKGPHRIAFETQALNGLIQSLEQRGVELYQVQSEVHEPTQSDAVQALITVAKRYGLSTVFCEALPAPEEQQAVKQIEQAGITVIQTPQSGLLDFDDLPFAVEQTPLMFTAFRKVIEAHGAIPHEPRPAPTSLPPAPALDLANDPTLKRLSPSRLKGGLPSGVPAGVPADVPADVHSAFPYLLEQWQGDEASASAHVERYFASNLPQHYKGTRNGLTGTDYSTKFSPWLAVGSLSPRAIYAALVEHETKYGANDDTYWIWFELLWREHYQLLMQRFGSRLFHRCGLTTPGPTSQPSLPEKKASARLKHWITGTTGQPFIDAGMRELAATGYLSNRLRQNVASYLIHDLALDWRAGAAWFEHTLIDYAVSSNQGNWAYIAGVGSDPRGGRRFNPDKQARDYDPQGNYQQLWANA